MSEKFVEILDFTQFYEHMAFVPNGQNSRKKVLLNEVHVKVGVKLVCGNMLDE